MAKSVSDGNLLTFGQQFKQKLDVLLATKQDTISDLATIRSGAALGATALQSYTESDPTVPAWAKASSKPSYTASEVGAIATSAKGAANGVAELDANGKVPSSQLPSYVDDVLEYNAKSSFPSTGETGKIYVDTSTNLTYRWSGTAYVEISPSLALGTTSSTAFRGDYGNTAYTHATNKGSAFSSGLYKITTNSEGHVTAATAVQKADITALGIPSENTTYGVVSSTTDGLAPMYSSANRETPSSAYTYNFLGIIGNGTYLKWYSLPATAFSDTKYTAGTGITITNYAIALTSTYAGGTAVTLNGTSKAASTASFYAPTSGGAANKVLIGNGTTSAPTWSGFTLTGTNNTAYNLATIASNASTAYGWGNHADAGYLPLTGGTISGTSTLPLRIDGTYYSTKLFHESGIAFLSDGTRFANFIARKDDGYFYREVGAPDFYDIYRLYDSGNFIAGTHYQAPISAGTGITISGNQVSVTANTYAPYNANGYLPLSGGQMTGSITVAGYTAFGVASNTFYLGHPSYPVNIRSNGTTQINGNTVYHSGNSNSTAVSWSAQSLSLAGAITGATSLSFLANANYARVSAIGWYTVYTSSRTNATADSVILHVDRAFSNNPNESYTIAINGVYSGKIKFSQLNGAVNTQIITKVRVVYVNSGAYIVQIYYSTSSANDVRITGSGTGTFSAPTRNDSPTGTAVEFALSMSGIATSGNVGIGTTSPDYKLDVNGQSRFFGASDSRFYSILGGAGIILNVDTSQYTGGWNSAIRMGANGTSVAGLAGLYSTGETPVIFWYGGTSQNDSALYIRWLTKFVGIGTNDPSYKLHVVGDIHATGTITPGSASDRSLKTNIKSMTVDYAKNIVMNADPVTFTWNGLATSLYSGHKGDDIGLVSQQVQSLVPSAIGEIYEKYQRLDYTKFIAPIIRVAQDHEERIQQIEKKLNIINN